MFCQLLLYELAPNFKGSDIRLNKTDSLNIYFRSNEDESFSSDLKRQRQQSYLFDESGHQSLCIDQDEEDGRVFGRVDFTVENWVGF